MSITPVLAEWIAESPPLATGRALELARDAMVDITGCMVAGAADPAVAAALRAVGDLGAGPASVVGTDVALTAPHAALVNGTAAHALDFDDNYHGNMGHATAVLAPALLALAEERRAGGAAVLDAYIAGLEAMLVVGAGVGQHHYQLGWHTTATIGTIGAAGAAARLMGLDAAGVGRALSLGFSHAGGSKRQFGTMAKPFHAGMAAKDALMAARYAEAGLTAVAEPLEGPWGFRDLFVGEAHSPGYVHAADLLGPPSAIERYGLKVKVHPNCASVHAAADGLLHLMRAFALAGDDIAEVETTVNKITYDNLMFDDPRSEMEARFSMHYGLALILERGRMTLADFRPDTIDAAEVRRHMPKVRMVQSTGEGLPTPDNGREPALVRIRTTAGEIHEHFMQYAKGVLQNPLTEAEMWAKFDDCVAGVLDDPGPLKAALGRFEDLPTMDELMTSMRATGPARAVAS